jgi:hypothetical protein
LERGIKALGPKIYFKIYLETKVDKVGHDFEPLLQRLLAVGGLREDLDDRVDRPDGQHPDRLRGRPVQRLDPLFEAAGQRVEDG